MIRNWVAIPVFKEVKARTTEPVAVAPIATYVEDSVTLYTYFNVP